MKILIFALLLSLFPISIHAQTYCQDTQPLFDSNGNALNQNGTWCFSVQAIATPTPTPSPTATNTATNTPTPTNTLSPTPTVTPKPNVKTVGNGQQYTTISAAVNQAASGDIIQVLPGVYPELVSIVNKPGITIQSDGGAWVDGECTRPNGIEINSNDVTIRGMGVKRTTGATILIGYDAPNTQNARANIEKNTIQDYNCSNTGSQFAAGIAAWYAGGGHRFVGNSITRRVEVVGPQAGQGNGIWIKNNSSNISNGGYYIADNIITGGYDGIGGETEGDPRGALDKDSIVERNTVKNCADDGIQVDGGGQNVVVQDNTILECGNGVSFAASLTGPLTVRRNTITSSTLGSLGTVNCFKVGHASTSFVNLDSNICNVNGKAYGANIGKGMQQTNSGIGGITATNNRYNVSAYVYELTPLAGSSFNDACVYSSDPTRLFKYAGTVYINLNAFKTTTGQELNATAGPC